MSTRRKFISLLGGAAAWHLAARAQQPERMRRVGVLIGGEDNKDARTLFATFQQALEQMGGATVATSRSTSAGVAITNAGSTTPKSSRT